MFESLHPLSDHTDSNSTASKAPGSLLDNADTSNASKVPGRSTSGRRSCSSQAPARAASSDIPLASLAGTTRPLSFPPWRLFRSAHPWRLSGSAHPDTAGDSHTPPQPIRSFALLTRKSLARLGAWRDVPARFAPRAASRWLPFVPHGNDTSLRSGRACARPPYRRAEGPLAYPGTKFTQPNVSATTQPTKKA